MHLLDSIIAFAGIFLIATLAVTAGTQLLISLLGLRGANLRRSLADLFENVCDDRDAKRYGKVIARRVLRHPLLSGSVFSRLGIRLEEFPFVPAETAGKLRWVGSGIPLQPWLLGAVGGFFLCPGALAAIERLTALDVAGFSAFVTFYIPFLSFTDHPWRTGAVVGAIFGGLLSRWRLASSVRPEELSAVLEKLSAPPGGSLPDPAQRAMLVIAGETQTGPRSKTNSTASDFAKFVRELPEHEEEDDVPMAPEKAAKQAAGPAEAKLEGLNSWFDRVMERASQRFTVQARVVTVALSLVLVFGAHLDAIRLFRSLTSDAQLRSQLSGSADALAKQAGQLGKTRDDGAGRESVPDLYRAAMVDVLQPVPNAAEQVKSKPHHSSHHSSTPASASAQNAAGDAGAESPDGVQVAIQASGDSAPVPSATQETTGNSAKQSGRRSSKSAKAKTPAPEPEKAAASSGENLATLEAKARANKILVTTPGFASREDAVTWLRGALHADPAVGNLIANYEQAVDAKLVSDSDKLMDHSASLRHDLARSELQLLPENRTSWKPAGNELPGLLVAVALLSFGAPICFNLLKSLASLRPVSTVVTSFPPERRIRTEDRRSAQPREQAKQQPRAQVKVQEKAEEEPVAAATKYGDDLV